MEASVKLVSVKVETWAKRGAGGATVGALVDKMLAQSLNEGQTPKRLIVRLRPDTE